MTFWRLIEGDCIEQMRGLPAGCVQTCVTSPPYFGLRDYGCAGQIGLEASPDEYVARLVEVFRGVRRVLRDDGTVWLNMGDSYAASVSSLGRNDAGRNLTGGGGNRVGSGNPGRQGSVPRADGCKPKDLLGIPWMVAFALRADGWYLRSEIIWHKPNPMPESVRDRPTKAHEQVFLLSKSPRYFYDAEAIAEAAVPDHHRNVDSVQYRAPGQVAHRGLKKRTIRAGIDTNGGGQGTGAMSYPLHRVAFGGSVRRFRRLIVVCIGQGARSGLEAGPPTDRSRRRCQTAHARGDDRKRLERRVA